MKKQHWIIEVVSWGTLHGIGTEKQAEEWRCHKANWEGSVARKRIATAEEIKSVKEWDSLKELLGD